jgi:hypothetical protein
MTKTQKPGEEPRQPGRYTEVGPRGGQVPDPRRINITPDDGHLPPTQKPGRRWEPTKRS